MMSPTVTESLRSKSPLLSPSVTALLLSGSSATGPSPVSSLLSVAVSVPPHVHLPAASVPTRGGLLWWSGIRQNFVEAGLDTTSAQTPTNGGGPPMIRDLDVCSFTLCTRR
ncbi:hypothetical protein V7S43_011126 [Phytophthora oleae]|uniref:Uncharacterized protein n=1 Tax=Phytophthora oleae TaxID=2107226 RepID=A0ABD3FBA1_9STRA